MEDLVEIFCLASVIIWIICLGISIKKNFAKILELDKEKNTAEKQEENEKLKKKYSERTRLSLIVFCMIGTLMVFLFLVRTISSWALKPIIYLYPEATQEISVKLEKKENLTCTYPKYENEWNVLASPNGNLVDLKTGRNLYSLYWEGKKENNNNFYEGFCVKGEDSAEFLEEKLKLLGLNDREAEEFIIYWLPKLESNKYNLIRFETKEEIEQNMPLLINPQPDTVIRIMMDFKGSNKYINIPEQKIITPERKGFVVVEWGGSVL